MFTLAHLSDLHLGALPRPGVAALLNKRCFAYMSWRLRRQAIHDGPVLPALVEDLRREAPDHIAITGDLTNIALPSEFRQARAWLAALGPADRISVVPGNHDAYVPVPWAESLAHWAPFMSSAKGEGAAEEPPAGPEDFPFVRLRGPVALVGVSTACPTVPFSAAGRVGRRQLEALETALSELGHRGFFRAVLMHHPPLRGGAERRKRLTDGAAFREAIRRVGAELVLFGHTHRSAVARLPTPGGYAPAISVPSASARPHPGKGHARYHLYRIGRQDGRWSIKVEVRGVEPTLCGFAREGRFALRLAA